MADLQTIKEEIKANKREFYVYLLKKQDGIPFYVGKGNCKGFRIGDHINEAIKTKRRNYKLNVIRSLLKRGEQIDYEVVLFTKDEKIAFGKEIGLIALYGRRDNKTGILTNMTDGGDGTSGRIVSIEEREKISKLHKGKVVSDQTRQKQSLSMKGKPSSRKGVILLKEIKQKISRSLLGNIPWNKGKTNTSQKGRLAWNKGKTKCKCGNKKGYKPWNTDKHISGMKGKHHTVETCSKISKKKRGVSTMTEAGKESLREYRKSTAKPKSPSQLCWCHCGEMTKPGNRYINGHGRKNRNFPFNYVKENIERKKGHCYELPTCSNYCRKK